MFLIQSTNTLLYFIFFSFRLVEKSHLVELEALFGKALLERALGLVYGKQPIVLYQTKSQTITLVEVPGSKIATFYKILHPGNFCSCESFRRLVLKEKHQPLCKHLLATRLALALNRTHKETLADDALVELKNQFARDCLHFMSPPIARGSEETRNG